MAEIRQTQGLVLRITPWSKTSLLADCLTREEGRLRFLAKGAFRPRSIFLGQLDLGYTCELLYYAKSPDRLLILKECAPIAIRPALRTNWKAAVCASWFCDLTVQVTPPGVPHDETYRLLETALDALPTWASLAWLVAWFELGLLRSVGLAPTLDRCPLCHTPHDPASAGGPFFLGARSGGIVCSHCRIRPGEPEPQARLAPATLAALLTWTSNRPPQEVPDIQERALEILTAMSLFLEYHLDIRARSRDIALGLLNAHPATLTR